MNNDNWGPRDVSEMDDGSQPFCGFCGDFPCQCADIDDDLADLQENDQDDEPLLFKAETGHRTAKKRPRLTPMDLVCNEDLPDLPSYFANYPEMAPKDIIACCRGYAAYLAAQGRARGKPESGVKRKLFK